MFGRPNVTIREVTERPETVDCGSNCSPGCAAPIETVARPLIWWSRPANDRRRRPEYLAHRRGRDRLSDHHEAGTEPRIRRRSSGRPLARSFDRHAVSSDRYSMVRSGADLQGAGLRARVGTRLGHEVQVLTGFPNYPGGRLYPGYRIRPFRRERIDGVWTSFVWPCIQATSRGRESDESRTMDRSRWPARPLVGAIFRAPARCDLRLPPAGDRGRARVGAWRARFGARLVYDIQDLWPDTVAASGMAGHPRLLSMLNGLCSAAYRRASRIVVLSPGFKAALTARGVAADKIDVIPNWCDEAALLDRDAVAPARDDDRFEVVFAGTMGAAQGLDTVLAAAEMLRTSAPHVRFTFVGGGIDVDRLQGLASARCADQRPVRAPAADREDFHVPVRGRRAARPPQGRPALQNHDSFEDAGLHGDRQAHHHGSGG